jgi:hypothetical protein
MLGHEVKIVPESANRACEASKCDRKGEMAWTLQGLRKVESALQPQSLYRGSESFPGTH